MLPCHVCKHPGIHAVVTGEDGALPASCGNQCRFCIAAAAEKRQTMSGDHDTDNCDRFRVWPSAGVRANSAAEAGTFPPSVGATHQPAEGGHALNASSSLPTSLGTNYPRNTLAPQLSNCKSQRSCTSSTTRLDAWSTGATPEAATLPTLGE